MYHLNSEEGLPDLLGKISASNFIATTVLLRLAQKLWLSIRILVQWTLKIMLPISTPMVQLLLPNWDPSKTNSEK
jgi:hypothetical protein